MWTSMGLKYVPTTAVSRRNICKCSGALTRILHRRVIVPASRHNFPDPISKPAAKFDRRSGVRSIQTLIPKIPYDIEIDLSHVATASEVCFDRLTSRLAFSPRPSKRFAERHILIVLSTAQKTAFLLRYTLPATPSTPSTPKWRPRQRCDPR